MPGPLRLPQRKGSELNDSKSSFIYIKRAYLVKDTPKKVGCGPRDEAGRPALLLEGGGGLDYDLRSKCDVVGPRREASSSWISTVSRSGVGLTGGLSAHSCRGGVQLVQPTGGRPATWLLEEAHRGTQDRKPRIGSNLG